MQMCFSSDTVLASGFEEKKSCFLIIELNTLLPLWIYFPAAFPLLPYEFCYALAILLS